MVNIAGVLMGSRRSLLHNYRLKSVHRTLKCRNYRIVRDSCPNSSTCFPKSKQLDGSRFLVRNCQNTRLPPLPLLSFIPCQATWVLDTLSRLTYNDLTTCSQYPAAICSIPKNATDIFEERFTVSLKVYGTNWLKATHQRATVTGQL